MNALSTPSALFVSLLTGDPDTVCTFQVLPDHPSCQIGARAHRGRFADLHPLLTAANERGAGVFLTINETNGRRRRKEDVSAVRALFVDGDHVAQPDLWALTPTIVQERGSKWHAFWRLKAGEDLGRWEAAMRALAAHYGTDKAVCELARVMRLPGFLHQKNPDATTGYRITESADRAYTIDEVLGYHGIDPELVTAAPEAPAAVDPLDGHEITADESARLLDLLARLPGGGRHNEALSWTVDAVAAGMDPADITAALEGWFMERGREPQNHEIANLIRDARAGLKTGKFTVRTSGVRPDLDFADPVAPEAPAKALEPAAAAAQAADLTDWRERAIKTKDGTWKAHVYNAMLVLKECPDLQHSFRFNLFTMGVEVVHGRAPWRIWPGTAEWTDDDAIALAKWVVENVSRFASIDPALYHAAVRPFAKETRYHPVRDYLDALAWDRTPRLATWIARYLGAEANAYHAAVGLRFLVGSIARIRSPGCKLDTMLVLEGPQGTYKSSAIRTLFSGPWFTDASLDVSNKDASAIIRGHWGVEFGEMHSAKRAEVTELKAFITRQEDRQRDAYARVPETHPRQCVFLGTTNSDEYLRDETGGRRFWPLVCGRIDLAALAADRDQLWAEADVLYQAGTPWWLTKDETALAEVEQARRLVQDEWIDLICSWLDKGGDFGVSPLRQVTGLEVWQGALCGSAVTFLRPVQTRIAECMRGLGYIRKPFRRDGRVIRGYERGNK